MDAANCPQNQELAHSQDFFSFPMFPQLLLSHYKACKVSKRTRLRVHRCLQTLNLKGMKLGYMKSGRGISWSLSKE